ncbi:MAG: phosphoribosylformylglycinamidine synthase subunit PurQ [Planctomycetota bacterium]|nr:phosphoribosylformylglycinamidine synthase subunit PurQ [Planctomycetota bacterium]
MSRPKALVLRSTGTNCQEETSRALTRGGADTDVIHTNHVLHDVSKLDPYSILVFAGGFSYGDDLGAGRAWGAELRHFLSDTLKKHLERGGLILGVCNGFQVLMETGIFEPEASASTRKMALYANESGHYECRWVHLETLETKCPWLVPGERFPVPVAHAEGRFVVRDDEALASLKAAGQLALAYTTPDGEGDVLYPQNPNGSTAHIAGVTDPTGRALGLMPHPERNLDGWNHPDSARMGKRPEGEGAEFYSRLVKVAAGAN